MRSQGKKLAHEAEPSEKIFHIRLRNTTEKVDLTDAQFLRILQQQYATKYLQSVGIEPSTKNITSIIRRYPLKDCELQQSRMNGGLHTDTITIIAHRKQLPESYRTVNPNAEVGEDTIKNINLKKMRTDLFKEDKKEAKTMPLSVGTNARTLTEDAPKTQSDHLAFNFDLEVMKSKYIFPFNQTFQRKKNNAIKENNDFVTAIDMGNNKLIFESKIFGFPFTQIKVPVQALKELQTPIKASMAEISNILESFCTQFPKQIIPIKSKPILTSTVPGKQPQRLPGVLRQQKSHTTFTPEKVNKVLDLLKSQQMCRFVGVLLHFSYWLVFGNVNPVQIEPALKNQMFLMMFETLEYFSIRIDDKKLWVTLAMPMILLCLKMVCEKIYRNGYPQFFEDSIFVKNSVGSIAIDKVMYLVDNLFDQTNLNGRFTFLQSNFNERQSGSVNDRKNIRKRIFGTSPILDFILPDPKDGKARSILAKKHEIQFREGIFELQNQNDKPKYIPNDLARVEQNLAVQRECQQKMMNVVLSKLQNKIESRLGKNNIIRLEGPDSPE